MRNEWLGAAAHVGRVCASSIVNRARPPSLGLTGGKPPLRGSEHWTMSHEPITRTAGGGGLSPRVRRILLRLHSLSDVARHACRSVQQEGALCLPCARGSPRGRREGHIVYMAHFHVLFFERLLLPQQQSALFIVHTKIDSSFGVCLLP